MNVNEVYSGSLLKAADLIRGDGTPVQVSVTIDDVSMETLEGDSKPKLRLAFRDKDKALILNKTNAGRIAEMHGAETDGWFGKTIKLYPDKTEFQGKIVDCIRVKLDTPEPVAVADDSDLPF